MISLNEHRSSDVPQTINGLVQDCCFCIANALEILQPYTKPSIWLLYYMHYNIAPYKPNAINALRVGLENLCGEHNENKVVQL